MKPICRQCLDCPEASGLADFRWRSLVRKMLKTPPSLRHGFMGRITARAPFVTARMLAPMLVVDRRGWVGFGSFVAHLAIILTEKRLPSRLPQRRHTNCEAMSIRPLRILGTMALMSTGERWPQGHMASTTCHSRNSLTRSTFSLPIVSGVGGIGFGAGTCTAPSKPTVQSSRRHPSWRATRPGNFSIGS